MADASDRRAGERMAVGGGTACGFAGPVDEGLGPVRVRDVSMDGVGLIVSRPVAVGTLLAVTLTNAERKLSKTVLVRVAHASAVPGGYLVGGTLAEPLTYQELTALVM